MNNTSASRGSSAGRRLSSDFNVIDALDLQLVSDTTCVASTGLDAAWRVSTPRDGSYIFSLSSGSVNVTQHVVVGVDRRRKDRRATSFIVIGLVVKLMPN